MKNKLSHLISWVFIPLLMPLYGLLIALFYPAEELVPNTIAMYALPLKIKWIVFGMFAVFSFAAPGLSFLGLFRFKIITTIDIENRTERLYPLLIMLIYGLMLYWLIGESDPKHLLPPYFLSLSLAGIVVTLTFMLLTQVLKISMHAGGAGILTGFLYAYFMQQHNPSYAWMGLVILISGLVISARWYLRKHTALELFLGYTLAGIITFGVVYIGG
ncbi:MAG: hypothetical protein RLZZ198_1598 [Bacteroidota bacterium]|jgi:hypothetical protein